MITFTIPGQPQGKGRAKIVRIGGFSRMATPQKTVAYEGLVAHEAETAMAGRSLIEGPCHVTLVVGCQVPASWSQKKQRLALDGTLYPTTKPDADNVLKAVFDGMNGVVWKDDVQCVYVAVIKRYSATPGVRVSVQPMPEAERMAA